MSNYTIKGKVIYWGKKKYPAKYRLEKT